MILVLTGVKLSPKLTIIADQEEQKVQQIQGQGRVCRRSHRSSSTSLRNYIFRRARVDPVRNNGEAKSECAGGGS